MSPETPKTVAERIDAVRKSLPPVEGRRSRKGYPSIDDFAAIVGVERSRIYAWAKGNAFPQHESRQKLAELSGGKFTPDDFAPQSDPGRVKERLEALIVHGERLAAELPQLLALARKQLDEE